MIAIHGAQPSIYCSPDGKPWVVSGRLRLCDAPELTLPLLRVLWRRCRVKQWSFDVLWDDRRRRGTHVSESRRLLKECSVSAFAFLDFFHRRARPLLEHLFTDEELAARGSGPWRIHVKLMLRWRAFGESYDVAPSWHQDFRGGPSVTFLWYFVQPQDAEGHVEFAQTDEALPPPADASPDFSIPLKEPVLVGFRHHPPATQQQKQLREMQQHGAGGNAIQGRLPLPRGAFWHRGGRWTPITPTPSGCTSCVPRFILDLRGLRALLSFVVWLPGDPNTLEPQLPLPSARRMTLGSFDVAPLQAGDGWCPLLM